MLKPVNLVNLINRLTAETIHRSGPTYRHMCRIMVLVPVARVTELERLRAVAYLRVGLGPTKSGGAPPFVGTSWATKVGAGVSEQTLHRY